MILLFLLWGTCFFSYALFDGMNKKIKAHLQPAKKKILVFTSPGGGGHTSASKAIRDYLNKEYEVTIIPIMEVLESFDSIKTLTFKNYSAEDFYNYLITNNWNWLTNQIFFRFGTWYMSWQQKSTAKALDRYLKYNHYDLVINVVPVFNGALLKAVQKHNIPLLIIPTDLDATLFIADVYKPDYKKFIYFLAFDDEEMRKKIAQAEIPEDRIMVSGFPIRPAFFQKKDKVLIKKDFNVPDNKKVIMVLMGAAGNKACFKYVRRLSKNKLPVHIIACIGRNEDTRKRIESLTIPEHISLTVVGFTDRIADLMAIADVLITKTGTVSFCEGLYSNVPMILDNTCFSLAWEAFNINFLQKRHLGDVVTGYKEVNPLLERYLINDDYKNMVQNNLKNLNKNNFEESLKKAISQLINPEEITSQEVSFFRG